MPDPNGEDDVVLYNFSSLAGLGGTPGKGGNAVLAGHMDSGSKPCDSGTVPPPCPAVLWDLNKLGVGDEVQIQLAGKLYRYQVTSTETVLQNARWDKIVASTQKETITLLTCGGDFNRQTRTYDRRHVVKAVRI